MSRLRGPDGHYTVEGLKCYGVTQVLRPLADKDEAGAYWVASLATVLHGKVKRGEDAQRWAYDPENCVWTHERCDPMELLEDAKYLEGEAYRKRRAYAERGTVIDALLGDWFTFYPNYPILKGSDMEQAVEQKCIDLGVRGGVCEDAIPYARQLFGFIEAERPRPSAWQLTVVNETHRYAGTLDAVCSCAGGFSGILSLKTSSKMKMERWWMAQEAAYQQGEYACDLSDTGELIKIDWARGVWPCAVLCVTPDAWKLRPLGDQGESDGWDGFLAALALARFADTKETRLPPKTGLNRVAA